MRKEGEERRMKDELFWLAEYEREALGVAMSKLEGEVNREVCEALRLFVDVTDLYGQIYIQKDITNRIK